MHAPRARSGRPAASLAQRERLPPSLRHSISRGWDRPWRCPERRTRPPLKPTCATCWRQPCVLVRLSCLIMHESISARVLRRSSRRAAANYGFCRAIHLITHRLSTPLPGSSASGARPRRGRRTRSSMQWGVRFRRSALRMPTASFARAAFEWRPTRFNVSENCYNCSPRHSRHTSVHPHGRGDNRVRHRVKPTKGGSPPRAWGQ